MVANKSWVLDTGAQGGIGKALVNEFVANNHNVIATDLVSTEFEQENVVSIQSDLERITLDEAYANELKNKLIK
jgi:nucleoside-diphosphate-sugar epimerase